MKLKFIYILLLCGFIKNANAQAPGYMGKRFMFSFFASPNLTVPTSYTYGNNSNDKIIRAKVHPRLGGSIDYIYARRFTIGLKYSHTSLNVSIPRYYQPNNNPNVATQGKDFPAASNCHSIGLRWTKYLTGNLPAPVGGFYGFNLGMTISRLKYEKHSFLELDGTMNEGTTTGKVLPSAFIFGGIRRGIGKYLMFSFTMDLNLTYPVYYARFSRFDPDNLNASPGNDIEGKNMASKTQYLMNRFMINSAYYNSYIFSLGVEFTLLPF